MDYFMLLRNIMEKEAENCTALLALSEQEKEAVIKNNVELLSSITEQQQKILESIGKLEADKAKALLEFRREGNEPEGKLRVQDVIESAKGTMQNDLQGLLKELEDLNKKLRRISALNQTLIETQLQYTAVSINAMTGQDSTPGMYSGSGRVSETGAVVRSLVDQAI